MFGLISICNPILLCWWLSPTELPDYVGYTPCHLIPLKCNNDVIKYKLIFCILKYKRLIYLLLLLLHYHQVCPFNETQNRLFTDQEIFKYTLYKPSRNINSAMISTFKLLFLFRHFFQLSLLPFYLFVLLLCREQVWKLELCVLWLQYNQSFKIQRCLTFNLKNK